MPCEAGLGHEYIRNARLDEVAEIVDLGKQSLSYKLDHESATHTISS